LSVLSDRLKTYLKKDRKEAKGNTRRVYDCRVRKILRKSFDDSIFILDKLGKSEVDKVSKDLRKQVEYLLGFYCRRFGWKRVEGNKNPFGRIKAYRIKGAFGYVEELTEDMFRLLQNAVDIAFGKDVYYVCLLSKGGYEDYRKWCAENRDKIVWKKP